MKVTIDKNICVGCGTCVALCATVFNMGEGGKAEAKEQAPFDECLDAAVKFCPRQAIDIS